ncbi:MAG: hypothetical protein ACJ8DF_04505, partial [Microvirga sp.]
RGLEWSHPCRRYRDPSAEQLILRLGEPVGRSKPLVSHCGAVMAWFVIAVRMQTIEPQVQAVKNG